MRSHWLFQHPGHAKTMSAKKRDDACVSLPDRVKRNSAQQDRSLFTAWRSQRCCMSNGSTTACGSNVFIDRGTLQAPECDRTRDSSRRDPWCSVRSTECVEQISHLSLCQPSARRVQLVCRQYNPTLVQFDTLAVRVPYTIPERPPTCASVFELEVGRPSFTSMRPRVSAGLNSTASDRTNRLVTLQSSTMTWCWFTSLQGGHWNQTLSRLWELHVFTQKSGV